MSDLNKPIVVKTKKILDDLGYDVKVSHVYELFSRLADEKSWNVAKSKGIDFMQSVSKLERVSADPAAENPYLKEYSRVVESGVFRNKFFLGIDEKGSLLLKDFLIEPNALFVGSMGTGKSESANCTLLSWMLNNSEQTIAFVVNLIKEESFNPLMECSQVYSVTTEAGVYQTIELIYNELLARKDLFKTTQSESILAHENKTKTKFARIVLTMENFDFIQRSILNFKEDFNRPETIANKFHTIMRVGRSLGVWVLAISQKATNSDIPSEIVPNFTQKQVFRVSRAESAYILGDTKAADIRSTEKGRCETDYGPMQFPQFSSEDQRELIKKYVKPLISQCAYMTPSIIESYMSSKTLEQTSSLQQLSRLIKHIDQKNPKLVVEMIHKAMGHQVKNLNSLADKNGLSHVVTLKDESNTAVMTRIEDGINVLQKHIQKLTAGMVEHNCEKGLLYTNAKNINSDVYEMAVRSKIEIVDGEDMLRLAHQIEAGIVKLE